MSDDMFDVETPKNHNLVEFARSACKEAVDLERQKAAMEESLKAINGRLNQLKMRDIPEAMASARLGSIMSLDTGEVIRIGEVITGNIPKEGEERETAIEALIEIGGEGIIKTIVIAKFPRGSYEEAKKARDHLMAIGVDADIVESIHHATLKSFVKEAVSKGEMVPMETLGLYMGPLAKIEFPK